MKRLYIIMFFGTATIGLAVAGCNKFVAVAPPKTQLVSTAVFTDPKTANAAVAGMYSYMYSLDGALSPFGGEITIMFSMASDDLTRPSVPGDPYLNNTIPATDGNASNLWTACYTTIYQANSIIEGLQHAAIPAAMKDQLTGEALFVRAFCHFYLVNCFGAVPLITSPDVNVSDTVGRTPEPEVYRQIVTDLQAAQSMTVGDYTTYFGGERVRANKFVVTAFLARVYLYLQDWADAEAQASLVINNTSMYQLLPNLSGVFLENNSEAIWQLIGYGGDGHTLIGNLQTPFTPTSVPPYPMTSVLVNSFEPGDLRFQNWVSSSRVNGQTYYRGYKYKNRFASTANGEYDVVLRLAEQLLIRAEARAKQGNLSGALQDLNQIRSRAGLAAVTPGDQAGVLKAIQKERQDELFAEWGHRWFDLKRTGAIDSVLGAEKPHWKATDSLCPIPNIELANNPRLNQNRGY